MKNYKITEKNGVFVNFVYKFMKPIDGIGSLVFKNHTTYTTNYNVMMHFKQQQMKYDIEEVE